MSLAEMGGGRDAGDDAALYRTALEAAPLACLCIRSDGEIAYANPAAAVFYSFDPAGRHIGELSVYATRDNWPNLWEAHAGAGEVRIQALHRTGSRVVPVAITAHFDAANGYVIEWVEPLDGAVRRWEPDFIYGPAPSGGDGHARRLTPREREILHLVAEGHAGKAIASALGIGVRTVETHRRRLMKKVGARSAAQLVRLAVVSRRSSE